MQSTVVKPATLEGHPRNFDHPRIFDYPRNFDHPRILITHASLNPHDYVILPSRKTNELKNMQIICQAIFKFINKFTKYMILYNKFLLVVSINYK